ncbi:MAG: tetratricopeptide repeat protein, partial [Bacteroidetes bacterium]
SLLRAISLGGAVNVNNFLGSVYVKQNRFEEAEAQFETVLKTRHKDIWGHVNMAWLLSLQQKDEAALDWLRKALETGKWSFEEYRQAPELDQLRRTEGYKTLMKKYFPDKM